MGKRGPRPQPTALKVARGNPGKRKINRREPKPSRDIGDIPEWLDPGGRECWAEVVPQLDALGVLTRIDRQALIAYCDTWSRYKAAVDFIRKHGEVIPVLGEDGKLKYMHQVPQVAIAAKLQAIILRYQQEFGLTPSSRGGIVAAPHPSSDDIEDFARSKPKVIVRMFSDGA